MTYIDIIYLFNAISAFRIAVGLSDTASDNLKDAPIIIK